MQTRQRQPSLCVFLAKIALFGIVLNIVLWLMVSTTSIVALRIGCEEHSPKYSCLSHHQQKKVNDLTPVIKASH